jgi:glycosyltransferase involved in cell wall biosynthesis
LVFDEESTSHVSLAFPERRDIFASVRFSIITPSLNQGRFIRDCIESVKNQTGVEIEHIVLDACSTDETVSILKGYPHVQWVSEPDKGQTDAINKGFLKATGDWLMWLNADDYLLPGALSKVAQFASNHPEADVIFGDLFYVREDRSILRDKREPVFSFRMLLLYGCFIPSTATFYRRRVVNEGLLLDPSYKVCMDYEYYLRLAHAGLRFMNLPEHLACFRWHDSNVSSTYTERGYQERLQVQRKYLALTDRTYLGNEWVLKAFFHGYRAKRLAARAVRKVLAR